jgi:hypothetical protein
MRKISRILGYPIRGYEEFCILGYTAVKPVKNQQNFRSNILPPFSWWKNKSSKKSVWKPVANRSSVRHIPPKRLLTFNRKHNIICHKIKSFEKTVIILKVWDGLADQHTHVFMRIRGFLGTKLFRLRLLKPSRNGPYNPTPFLEVPTTVSLLQSPTDTWCSYIKRCKAISVTGRRGP